MAGRLKQPFWIVPLVIAGLVALFAWWANVRLRETVEAQLQAKLNSILDANVASLEIWTTNQTRMATLLADDPVRTVALRLLERPIEPPGELRRPPEPNPDLEAFGNLLRPRLSQLGYVMAQLVDSNNMVIASSLRGRFRMNQPVQEAHTSKFLELFATEEPVLITPFK